MLFQDTNDDKIDLLLFEDAMHQTAKLTSDTVEVKVLLCLLRHPSVYLINRRSKVAENVNCHVIIDITSSFCCGYFTS